MRGWLLEIAAYAAGCYLGMSAVSAQTVVPPTPTPMAPTASPTAVSTPAPASSPTPRAGSLDLPSAKASVDQERAMDAAFMTRAELRGLEEVELGRIAAGRASSPDLRAFGQQVVQYRGKANEELRLFARSEAIELPAAVQAARKAETDRISRLSSQALDLALALAMAGLEDADVADLRQQAEKGQEVELQGWVYDTPPLLENQRDEIHRIAGEVAPPAPPASLLCERG